MLKTEVHRPKGTLLYSTDFWDPASEGGDKGELTHLPAGL